MDNQKGFIYYSVYPKYIQKALLSVASLRKHMPNIPVCVFTSEPDAFQGLDVSVRQTGLDFDKLARMQVLLDSPFDNTFFIDSDTYFLKNCEEIFDVLNGKELVVSQSMTPPDVVLPDVPQAFPLFNGGIIGYKKTHRVYRVFTAWIKEFERLRVTVGITQDEPSLRNVLYAQPVDMSILPSYYNFRITTPQIIYDPQKIAILHGHTDDFPALGVRIRAASNPLFYEPEKVMASEYRPAVLV